jgi:3-oxoadipate enol-lactonase
VRNDGIAAASAASPRKEHVMRAEIAGFDIGYDEVAAARPPLVLLHGFPFDRSIWARQSGGLADGFRVIAPDLRGFGDSAPRPGPTTMDAYAQDVAGLLDHLGVRGAVVGGVSMGGYVALAFLRLFPNRVRALVLVDTRAGADSADAKKARDDTIALVRASGVAALAERMLPKLLTPRTLAGDAPLVERLRTMMASQSVEAVVGALTAMRDRPDSTATLATIAVPTLVVCGADDALIPTTESKAMAAAIPGARLASISNVGHLPNYERPKAFNDAVSAFLKSLMESERRSRSDS